MENNSEAKVTIDPDSLSIMTDDEIINFTQKRRRLIVNQLMQTGTPSSVEDRSFLMQALDGMDRAALGNKRIKSNDKLADETARVSRQIAAMIGQIGNTNPFQRTGNGSLMENLSDPEALPEATIIEGEFQVGTTDKDFGQFMEENGFGPAEEKVDESGKIISGQLSAKETSGIIIEDENSYFDPNAQ